MRTCTTIGGAVALAMTFAVAAEVPTTEQLWELVQAQQAQIDALQAELRATRDEVSQTGQQVQAVEVRADANDATVAAAEETLSAMAEAPPSAEWAERSQFGGYGEVHYNGGDKDEIDVHRFVLFFGHQFNERLRFNSELEVEHVLAGDGEPGAVELEQAYVEFDLAQSLRARAGLFLLPVGIINETHEPPTFYGVERNPVESRIIPSTWWEGGVALSGLWVPGLSWDAALHSGLAAEADSNYAIRDARQEVAQAIAKNAAVTGRIKYTAIPGLQLAASIQYQDNAGQGADPGIGSARLFEGHLIWSWQSFGLKALYARWDLQGSGPESVGADVQDGFYIEPSWRISPRLGVFARYNQWDNRAGDQLDSQWQQTDVGINFWPHPDVVLKADYQFQNGPGNSDGDDRINLGIGYQF